MSHVTRHNTAEWADQVLSIIVCIYCVQRRLSVCSLLCMFVIKLPGISYSFH